MSRLRGGVGVVALTMSMVALRPNFRPWVWTVHLGGVGLLPLRTRVALGLRSSHGAWRHRRRSMPGRRAPVRGRAADMGNDSQAGRRWTRHSAIAGVAVMRAALGAARSRPLHQLGGSLAGNDATLQSSTSSRSRSAASAGSVTRRRLGDSVGVVFRQPGCGAELTLYRSCRHNRRSRRPRHGPRPLPLIRKPEALRATNAAPRSVASCSDLRTGRVCIACMTFMHRESLRRRRRCCAAGRVRHRRS